MQKRVGLLLVNLGSPKSSSRDEVKIYLKQFLNDPYVIDLPAPLRWLLVNGLILNVRPQKTAEAYQQIWTKDGAPLVNHTRALTAKISKLVSHPVEFGMRYGDPSIENAVKKLIHQGVNHVVMLPLYPQFSFAASETAIVEFERILKSYSGRISHSIVEDFFEHPAFIKAQAATIKPFLDAHEPDLLMLSYHGIPKKQLKKTRNAKDYQAHCLITSDLLAAKLNLPKEKVLTTFQSRIGPTEWIKPFTDEELKTLPQKGVKKIVVASPSFTADCLETLEEIQIRYKELFLKNGGELFEYAPCVNSTDLFAEGVVEIIKIAEKKSTKKPNLEEASL